MPAAAESRARVYAKEGVVKKRGVRKLVLNIDTLRRLDPSYLEGAEGGLEIHIRILLESATCASNRPCTGCVPCVTTG